MDELNPAVQSSSGSSSVEPTADSSQPKKKVSKKFLILIGAFIAFLALPVIFFFVKSNSSNTTKALNEETQKVSINLPAGLQQWQNCDDIREVLEEDDKIYVGCMGGFLVSDKNGNVLESLTMTGGLNDQTVTDFVKDGDVVYIGTQRGFNIYNLRDKTIQSITEEQGLLSNSNIELALDGDYLWVGNFEGLNRYNIKTKALDSFTNVLIDNATDYNASEILVTPKAVYVISIAHDGSPGGVARYDKVTNSWERFGPSSFPKNPAERHYDRSRIDLYKLASIGDYVLVGNHGDAAWQIKDNKGSSWESVNGMDQIIGTANEYMHLFSGTTPKAYFLYSGEDSSIYSYDPVLKEMKRIFPAGTSVFLKDTGDDMFGNFVSGEKIWLGTTSDVWLKWINPKTLETGEITLKDRPKISSLVAVINHKGIIGSGKQLLEYNGKGFSPLLNLNDEFYFGGDYGQYVFQPIYNTSKIFIFKQSCGQGCSKPVSLVFDYKTKEKKIIDFPKTSGSEFGYEYYVFNKYDFRNDRIIFNLDSSTDKIFVVNTKDFSFKEEANQSLPKKTAQNYTCNPVYEFKNEVFVENSCPEKAENNKYEWKIEGNRLSQIDKTTNKSEIISIPIPDVLNTLGDEEFAISHLRFFDNKLWLSTSRGLLVYSSLNRTWKTITSREGLITNDPSSYAIDGNNLWAESHWGGLSYFSID